ncbi:transcriptional regulator [Psychrobacillus glaciei]|uniref:Transcriptional regulator n=1 Tax=Psychrobacillus glaciei TaxID=2283160 RepID=A0A5J6SLX6_9BACI|nr:transcriptional regulator [Psychrobacillus glaciei]QFF98906.1 transcriptional regulator [Psychrobacillus glaciei]
MRINILKCLDHGQLADMIYISNTGEISKRRVKVLSVDDTTFKAYCFLRNTKRTFKIENVLAFVPVVKRERDVI